VPEVVIAIAVTVVIVVAVGAIWVCIRRRRELVSRQPVATDSDVLEVQMTQLRTLLEAAATEGAVAQVLAQLVPGPEGLTWEGFAQQNGLSGMVTDLRKALKLDAAVNALVALFQQRRARVLAATSEPARLSALCTLHYTWIDADRQEAHGHYGVLSRLSAAEGIPSAEEILAEIQQVAGSYRDRLVPLAETSEQAFMELLYLFYAIRGYDWRGPAPVKSKYGLEGKDCEWVEPPDWVELVGTYLERPKLRDFNRSLLGLGGTDVAEIMGIRSMVTHVLFEGTRAEAKLVEAYFAQKPSLVLAVGDLFSSAIGIFAWRGVRLDPSAILAGQKPR